MTSTTPLQDLQAAKAHVDATVSVLTGKNRTDAQAIVTSLTKLIVKLGGS